MNDNILNAVIESTGDLVYVKDLDGRYLLVNSACATLAGLSPEKMQGRDAYELFSPDVAEHVTSVDRKVVATGQVYTTDESVPLPGGRRIFETVRAPFRDQQQRIVGVVVIGRDVTRQRRQAELNRFRAEASAVLARSIDYETRLANVANLAVSEIADWCIVHIVADDGHVQELALAHRDPSKFEWARDIRRRYPQRPDATGGVPQVLRTGKPEFVPELTDEMLAQPGISPEDLAVVRELGLKSYMIVPMIAQGRTLGAITFLSTEHGHHFDANDLTVAENLASRAAVYIENAKLYREMQRINETLEQRVAGRTGELAAAIQTLRGEIEERQRAEEIARTLFRIGNKLNATLELDSIMFELTREAAALINAESGLAGLHTPQGMDVRAYCVRGEPVALQHTWRPGEGMPGWVLLHKQPYVANDAPRDPVMLHALSVNAGVRNAMCTPILDAQGEVLGYFDLRNKRDGADFTDSDRELLMMLAPVASIAIQNAQAYQRQARAESEIQASYQQVRALAARLQSVREEERSAIARDLHDGLGQALTALKFDLAWLVGRLSRTDEMLRDKAQTISTQIDGTIKMVRRLSSELRPGMLDDFGLATSIESYAQEFEERTGIRCDVRGVEQEPELTRAQSIALFRIFQEALTNVARHAQAAQVTIRLEELKDELCLQVCDNGRGLPADVLTGTRSLGVLGMRERAELLDGKLEIAGAAGAGTTVTVTIPLQLAESGSRATAWTIGEL